MTCISYSCPAQLPAARPAVLPLPSPVSALLPVPAHVPRQTWALSGPSLRPHNVSQSSSGPRVAASLRPAQTHPTVQPRLTWRNISCPQLLLSHKSDTRSQKSDAAAAPRTQARMSGAACKAGWQLPGPLEKTLQGIAGPRVFFFSLMLFVVSQVLFANITAQISAAAAAVRASLPAAVAAQLSDESFQQLVAPLDVQHLYTPSSLAKTLALWGPDGRMWFVVYQFVDVLLFFSAYAGLLLWALNGISAYMQQQQQVLHSIPGFIRVGYAVVLVLLLFDFCEDFLQLLLCDTFRPGAAAPAEALQQHWSWQCCAAVCCVVHIVKFIVLAVNLMVVTAGAAQIAPAVLPEWFAKVKRS